MLRIDREALARNEAPYALSFFPSGEGERPAAVIILDDEAVQLASFKRAKRSSAFMIRLYEPTGKERKTVVRIPHLNLARPVRLQPFEVLTLLLDPDRGVLTEGDLMEQGTES
jgi:alpha-mannosidase